MKHTLRNYTFHAVHAVLLGLILSSTSATAQKRDDILSIQRDVAQLQDQIKQLQAGQDQKIALLESLIKQALEESSKVSTAAASLQRTLSERLGEQQSRVEAPIAALGTKIDQSGDDVRAARENLADLTRRMANLDNKLADISSAVRTLSTTAAPPPPPSVAGVAPGPAATTASAASTASTTPAGVSADALWKRAVRDYSGARDKQALSEFADFTKYFPDHRNAAEAQYYMGLIYDHGEQYVDAAQVFEAVAERYPESPKAADAMYMKGVEYQKAKNDKKAIAAYRMYLKEYPNHADATKARARLRILLSGQAAGQSRKRK